VIWSPEKEEPKQKAAIEIWAQDAQEKISEAVNSEILKGFGKKNMRSLNSDETRQSEMMKFEILCNLEPGEDISQECIFAAINDNCDSHIHEECNSWIDEASDQIGRRLGIEEIRNLRAAFYADLKS
jgi:phage shock protein A